MTRSSGANDAPAPFDAYVSRAGPPRAAWRVGLALVLVVAVWGLWTAAVVAWLGPEKPPVRPGEAAAPAMLGVLLTTFAGLWLGLWLALRRFHGTGLGTIVGPFRWRDPVRGLALGAGTAALALVLAAAVGYAPERTEVEIGNWVQWLGPLALLIAVQSGAEEALFRGYLLQRIALRFRHPAAWAGIPALLFGLLHANPALPVPAALLYVATTAIFGLAAAALVWRTGSLGAAIGLHAGFNLTGLLIVGVEGPLPVSRLWSFPEGDATALLAIDAIATTMLLVFVSAPALGRRAG